MMNKAVLRCDETVNMKWRQSTFPLHILLNAINRNAAQSTAQLHVQLEH